MRVELEKLYVDEHGFIRVLAWVESSTTYGELYGVYLWLRDGKIVRSICTCKGFAFQKHCKHVEWVRATALTKIGKIQELPAID
jgi:uncharacterized Zn finger protein